MGEWPLVAMQYFVNAWHDYFRKDFETWQVMSSISQNIQKLFKATCCLSQLLPLNLLAKLLDIRNFPIFNPCISLLVRHFNNGIRPVQNKINTVFVLSRPIFWQSLLMPKFRLSFWRFYLAGASFRYFGRWRRVAWLACARSSSQRQWSCLRSRCRTQAG